jgi:hypothetical protein
VLVSLVISFLENENHYSDDGKERNESSLAGNVLRGIVSFFTFVLIVLVIRHSVILFRITRERLMGAEYLYMNYWQSRYALFMLAEVVVNVIH